MLAKLKNERIKSEVKIRLDTDAAKAQMTGVIESPVGTSQNPSSKIFTLANCITFTRFILTLIFVWLFVNHINRSLALILYAVAASTDFLDGQIARRTQTVSWVGKLMDPIMDRVLLFTGVLGLILTGELPLWIAVYVIGRDIYLAVGSILLQRYRIRPVDVIYIGKIATACLMSGFTLLLLNWPQVKGFNLVSYSWLPGLNGSPASFGIFVVYAGVFFSIIATIIYSIQALQIRSQSRRLGMRLD